MTKMDEASNPCGGDIEAEMCQLMREQPPAEGVVDRVALQRHRNVALITLSHPQAQNALNLASWRRLKRLLDDLAGESGLRAVVLRGAGDKAFAAGADIKEFPNTRMSAADAAEYNESLAVCLRALTTMPIPVIAAVRGSPSVAAVSWRRPAMCASRPTTRASASRWASSASRRASPRRTPSRASSVRRR